MSPKKTIKIATRQSKLAWWQAHFVKQALEKNYPDIRIELIGITTEGDQEQMMPLTENGGKANFVKALQNAILNHKADIAVHSMKDMSVFPVEKLILAAICERGNPFDAFVSNQYADLFSLPKNAIIGTASPRRTCFVKSLRPDVQIKLLRGNVDTRLAKLDAGEYDAIILAAAGLERLDLKSRIRSYFSEEIFLPAIGQGAIGIECREEDEWLREIVAFLHHIPTAQCVIAERIVNQIMGGGCHSAIGVYAKIIDDHMKISAMMCDEQSNQIIYAHVSGNVKDADLLAKEVARQLCADPK